MSGSIVRNSQRRLSRRAFLRFVGIAAGALIVPWARVLPPRADNAVVSIHMDKPYVDSMGNGLDYLPRGFRDGARPLLSLSEYEWRMRYPYL